MDICGLHMHVNVVEEDWRWKTNDRRRKTASWQSGIQEKRIRGDEIDMTMSVEYQKWIDQQRMLTKLRQMKALREISDHKQQILGANRGNEGEEFVDDYQKTVRDS